VILAVRLYAFDLPEFLIVNVSDTFSPPSMIPLLLSSFKLNEAAES
jgi:hypothetical protein